MGGKPPAARDYFLACYTVSLVQGKTILGTPIRHSTIKLYLAAARHFLDRDAAYEADQQLVEIILKSVKDYKDMPRRCRMITDKMMRWLVSQAALSDPHSSTRPIVDWILLGRYTGFSASEWSQKSP